MDLMIPLDRDAAQPLRDQIYGAIRSAIVAGTLTHGGRLPSTRELARQLGVSRLTVDDAYARLAAEEYIAGRRGSGTYVSAAMEGPPAGGNHERSQAPEPAHLSRWGQRIGSSPPFDSADRLERTTTLPFNLSAGTPGIDAFPMALWQRLQARALRTGADDAFDYGSDAGLVALRETVAAYLGRSRGVHCAPEQVVITSGTQQSLDLLTRLTVDPGDKVVIEEPAYPALRAILTAAGADIAAIPVDAHGLQTDLLPDPVEPCKLACVTPSHQYPTGALLPLSRRLALLHWAGRAGALVVEDDYDSELRYDARPVPALAALAAPGAAVPDSAAGAHGRVAYLGTFSKVLYPALRLGYVVLDDALAGRFLAAKRVIDRHPPTHLQATAAAFIGEGHFERHLVRMRRLYAARQATLIDAVDTSLRGIAFRDTSVGSAGLHVFVRFDVGMDERELVARAAAGGVQVSPGGECFASPPEQPQLLLGYAAMPEDGIREGVRRLAGALGHRPPRRSDPVA